MGNATLALAVVALVGCRRTSEEDPPPYTETGTPIEAPTDTATPDTAPPPDAFTASCAPQQGNALRFVCTLRVEPPQAVAVTFARADGQGPSRTHRSEGALSEHVVGLYLMAPETDYDWTASPDPVGDDPELQPISGRFTTGALPPEVAAIQVQTEGQSTAGPIGFVSPCGGALALIVDPDTREVLWYQEAVQSMFGFLDGVTFSDQGTLLAIVDGSVQELDAMGNTLLSMFPGSALPFRTHHDVFRLGDRVYALFQERAVFGDDEYLMDGFYVIEGGAVSAQWHLKDHVVPPPHDLDFPVDWSHANAVWVDGDGEALLSFRHLSAVMRVVADPDHPEFGAVRWTLSAPGSDLPSDFVFVSEIGPPEDFRQQHNVFVLPDGRMTLFDNRIDPAEPSRVLELQVDPPSSQPGSGVATLERAFDLPLHCSFQGGSLRTPAGNPLATCAPFALAFEYDAVTGEEVFWMQTSCDDGFGRYIPRFSPVSW